MTGIGNHVYIEKKTCKHCHSEDTVKSGVLRNKQRYKCKSCKRHFQKNTEKKKSNTQKQEQIIKLYLEGTPIRGIARLLEISHTWVIKFIKKYSAQIKPHLPLFSSDIEIDELYLYIGSKKKKRWLWTALCRKTKRILAFHIGQRSRSAVTKLYENIKPIECNHYYTDSYKGFLTVFPKEKHKRNYAGTNTIEGFHSSLRHYQSRFRRRSKCYSKSESMVKASMVLMMDKYHRQYTEQQKQAA